MEVIVPAAGRSSRYPGQEPKYLLKDSRGKMMFERSIESLIGKYPITAVILEEHDKKYNASQRLRKISSSINIKILEGVTRGPAETVYHAVKDFNKDCEFIAKDCDTFFDISYQQGNIVYTTNIKNLYETRDLKSKSYVVVNEQDIITNIVEKEIVSNHYCIGGYKFQSSIDYCQTFEQLKNSISKEIFISHVISYMIDNGLVFTNCDVLKFVDVPTLEEWQRYNELY